MVIEDDNLYGEGVNVAARLEALAQSGGICLSKNVHEIVNKKTGFEFHDLGEQKVKTQSFMQLMLNLMAQHKENFHKLIKLAK